MKIVLQKREQSDEKKVISSTKMTHINTSKIDFKSVHSHLIANFVRRVQTISRILTKVRMDGTNTLAGFFFVCMERRQLFPCTLQVDFFDVH